MPTPGSNATDFQIFQMMQAQKERTLNFGQIGMSTLCMLVATIGGYVARAFAARAEASRRAEAPGTDPAT